MIHVHQVSFRQAFVIDFLVHVILNRTHELPQVSADTVDVNPFSRSNPIMVKPSKVTARTVVRCYEVKTCCTLRHVDEVLSS